VPLECNLESLARQEEKGSSGVDYWTPVMMASHGATSLTVESRSIVSKQLVRHSQSTEKRQESCACLQDHRPQVRLLKKLANAIDSGRNSRMCGTVWHSEDGAEFHRPGRRTRTQWTWTPLRRVALPEK